MDLNRLIQICDGRRRFPKRRVTYAEVEATCPMSKAEAIERLHRVRCPNATPAEVRTHLRRIRQAFPRTELSFNAAAWREAPEAIWAEAIRAERGWRIAQLTRQQMVDAIVIVQAAGAREDRLARRLQTAYPAKTFLRLWADPDLDGDPEEIADRLIELEAGFLARVAEPEMQESELVAVFVRALAWAEGETWGWQESPVEVLNLQLPNADVVTMWTLSYPPLRRAPTQDRDPVSFVRAALARQHPDLDTYTYCD